MEVDDIDIDEDEWYFDSIKRYRIGVFIITEEI